MDPYSIVRENVASYRNEILPKTFGHLLQGSCSKEDVRNTIRHAFGQYEDFINNVRKRKLKLYDHITRSVGLSKKSIQGTVQGGRRKGRQKKRWIENISE